MALGLFNSRMPSGASDESFEAGIFSRGFAHVGVVGHHIDFWEIVALANFEVVGIVRGCDFHDGGREYVGRVGRVTWDMDASKREIKRS